MERRSRLARGRTGERLATATRAWLGCAAFLLLARSGGAVTLDVQTYWVPEGDNEFAFFVEGRELCRFHGQAPPSVSSTVGHCRFELPAGATSLVVKGRYTTSVWNSRTDRSRPETKEGQTTVRLRDGSPLTAALRDPKLSVGERWRRTRAADVTFAESYGGSSIVELSKPSSRASVDAAEARLGFRLPPGYRELVTAIGPVGLGDHYAPDPKELVTARQSIVDQWGYDAEGVPDWMSREALALLERSVILFVEVGDGLGAELFVAPPTASCGDDPAFAYLHEESMATDLDELAKGSLRCTSFEQMMLYVYERYAMLEHETNVYDEAGALLIDFGAAVQSLHLRYAVGGGSEFAVNLSRE